MRHVAVFVVSILITLLYIVDEMIAAVIIIISFIVIFFSRNEMADTISAFMFLVGTIVLLATTVIDMVEGR